MLLWYIAEISESAISVHSDCKEVFAKLLTTYPTVAAVSAIYIGIHCYMITNFKFCNSRTNRFNNTRDFMPENHRWIYFCRSFISPIYMYICSAYSACSNSEKDFSLLQLVFRYLTSCEIMIS